MKKNIKLRTWTLCLAIIAVIVSMVAINAFAAEEPTHCPDGAYVNGICDGCGEYQPAMQTTDKYDVDGDEIMDSIYEIGNAGQLYWFAQQVNGGNTGMNAVLAANIVVNTDVLNANGYANAGNFMEWTPIGSESNPYNGVFDGCGNTISGLYYSGTQESAGLFACTGSAARVKNLGVVDSYFLGPFNGYVAGVVGYNAGVVEKCYNESTIYNVMGYAGGIVGYNDGGVVINCSNLGLLDGDGGTQGGIVAENYGVVKNCYNKGEVRNYYPLGAAVVGGNNGTVENCYYLEGIAPYSGYGTVMTEAQFNSGEVTYLLNGDQSEIVFGQIIGTDAYPSFFNGNNRVYAYKLCPAKDAYANAPVPADNEEHNFVDSVCTICGAEKAPDMVDGYYIITNVTELYWFADYVNSGNTSANAKLGADIVVNQNVLVDGVLNTNADVVAAFRTWNPIGSKDNPYIGTFDGQNYTISGLYFNDEEASYIGLFTSTGETALIENVCVAGSYFYGKEYIGSIVAFNKGTVDGCSSDNYIQAFYYEDYDTYEIVGGWCVGGVVGNNAGMVKNCHNQSRATAVSVGGIAGSNTGSVIDCSNSGYIYTNNPWERGDGGGIVGYNSGLVTRCFNSGCIEGGGGGGLVGYNSRTGTVTNGYNTGTVNCWMAAGGIVFDNYGTVEGCYNAGLVKSRSGLASGVAACNYSGGKVQNCYSAGAVSGYDTVGGVVAYNSNGIVINCYYLEDSANGEYDTNSEGTAKTEAQFNSGEVAYLLNGDQSEIVFGQTIGTDDYPVFFDGENQVYACALCPSKDGYVNADADGATPEDNPDHTYENGVCIYCGKEKEPDFVDGYYIITNVEELYWFARYVNSGNTTANAKLGNDIIVNQEVLNENGTLKGTRGDLTAWTPIGSASKPYIGHFDGQTYTISGLYCYHGDYVGLFEYIGSGALVENLGIVDSYFSSSWNYLASIVGYNYYGTVKNCYNAGSVLGSDTTAGGLVGCNYGTVENCYNRGSVESWGTPGGVVGRNYGTVQNCYYLDTCVGDDPHRANDYGVAKTEEEFASGEVMLLLGEAFGQDLAKGEKWPTLGGPRHTVVVKFADGNETGYGDLSEALNDAKGNNGCTVIILLVIGEEDIVISEGVFDLEFRGKQLINTIVVEESAKITITYGNFGNITARNRAEIIVTNGKFSNITAQNGGRVTIDGENVTLAGVLKVEEGEITIIRAAVEAGLKLDGITLNEILHEDSFGRNEDGEVEIAPSKICVVRPGASLDEATIVIDNAPYTGEPIPAEKLVITVTIGGKTLVLGEDFAIVNIANNTALGINTAEVTIRANTPYTGEKTLKFSIVNCATDFQSMIAELEARLAELEGQIGENLQEAIDAIRAELEALQSNYATIDALNAAIARIDELANEISALENRVTANETAIDEIRQELAQVQEDVMNALNSGNADLANQIQKLKNTLNMAIAANGAADREDKNELTVLIREAKAVLQSAIDQVAADLEQAKLDVYAAILAGDKALEEKIVALEAALAAAVAVSDAADDALKAQIDEAVTTLNVAIANVRRDVDDMRDKVNNMAVVAIALVGVGMTMCVGLVVFFVINKRKMVK